MSGKKKLGIKYFVGKDVEVEVFYTGCESGYVLVTTPLWKKKFDLAVFANSMRCAVLGILVLAGMINGEELYPDSTSVIRGEEAA